MGAYTRGNRNNSGQMLINLCECNNLFIANSAFKHSARHITTWSQRRKKNGKEYTLYNQIDYILVSNRRKHVLVDSRSYSGTEKKSDHRIVVTRMDINWPRMYKNNNNASSPKLNTNMLHDPEARLKYQTKLKEINSNEHQT